MKRIFFNILFFFFTTAFAMAQKAELLVKNSDKGLYLDHKVAPRESFYAIGRLYNVSPKYLASFNKIDMNKGLQIDQKLRIPLTDTNFTQQGNSGTPVYYKVGEKEGLMTVSNKNNKVLLASLRNWNALASDDLKENTKLIIGFLLSKEMPSVTINNKPMLQEEPPLTKEKPPVVDPKLSKDEKKAEEKEGEAELKAEKKDDKKKPEVVTEEKRVPTTNGEGYFKPYFEQQIKTNPVSQNETVTSGIFKTASGWQDGKYYLLIDKIPTGTIVKVINPTNNKAIFAKVLGQMSGIRQNEGLNIRISNAAASVLDISDEDKFIVKVNY